MLRMKYIGCTILSLSLWAGSLVAQTRTGRPSPGSTDVVRSGGYQLTEQMLEHALRFGQILASGDFSPSDAAALRADLIARFQKEPAKQMQAYQSVAKTLQQEGQKPSWVDFAILRYNWWQGLGNPQRLLEAQRYPFESERGMQIQI